jgi:endonuclease/exonuclease/phosphatase family metal-dependent hydrolase
MLIATWNVNHRTGKTRFRLDAVNAIVALQADVVVLTEYYPQKHHIAFCTNLSDAGWPYFLTSPEIVGEIANRVLIASRLPIEPLAISLPTFDRQFPPNILAVMIPTTRLRIIGLRIPAYEGKDRTYILAAWDWLETIMAGFHDAPTVVLGDLNANPTSSRVRGGEHFRRILDAGWHRAIPPGGASYFGLNGTRSEVDHLLCNSGCRPGDARYVIEAAGWHLAGGKGTLSDHAALLVDVYVRI